MSNAEISSILDSVDRSVRHPPMRPRDASTLIIIDRSGSEPQVLFGRRHARHTFMPNKFVFPGGRIEPLDRRVAIARPLHPLIEKRLMLQCMRPSEARAKALALTAIRETAEETGLILGQAASGPLKMPGEAWAVFEKTQVLPDLGDLHFVARAITPPGRSRRYDTRFFVIDASAIAHRIEGIVGPDTELVELVWIPLTRAATLDLPPITRVMLLELRRRTEAGFGHELPVPFYKWHDKKFTRFMLP